MQPTFKKSHFAILGFLALLSQTVAITTVQIKGNLVDQLIQKQKPLELLLILVAVFAGLQIFGALTNIFSEHLNRVFSVTEFERHWKQGMPTTIQRPYQGYHHKLYNGLYNNIPKLFGLKVSILLQSLTAWVYAGFFIFRMIHDQYWLGMAFIPVIGLFSWSAGHLYSKTYQEGTKQINNDRVALSSWLELWFRSSRERTLNWSDRPSKTASVSNPLREDNQDDDLQGTFSLKVDSSSWFLNQGQKVAKGIRRHAQIVFKRDLFGSLLVDWPYILCVTTVLISVVLGKLTIGEFLIWTTLIDYLMTAFSSLRFIKKCRLDSAALHDQLSEDLGWISENCAEKSNPESVSDPSLPSPPTPHKEPSQASEATYRFQLLSGETTLLSLKPGLYRISGSNGSGKSTLLDTLLGMNDHYDKWDPHQIRELRSQLQSHSRVIERDCVIFPEYHDHLMAQIFGQPYHTSQNLLLVKSLNQNLPPTLAKAWEKKITQVEALWNLRPGSLSSGEKVVLAFLRMMASLSPGIKLIVVDECDSVLDHTMADLFQETMFHLSQKYAIWYVSHSYSSFHSINSNESKISSRNLPSPLRPRFQTGHSFLTSVYLLGYERQASRGFVTPCQIAALTGGSGKVIGSGNVGTALAEVFQVVKRAFIHANEDYRVLDHYDWQLDSAYKAADVGEIKSAGLAIAVGILSVLRQSKGLSDLRGFAATGHILLDASVVPVDHVDAKEDAAKGLNFIKKILSFKDISHLSQLDNMLDEVFDNMLLGSYRKEPV